jgi:AcrR family transcriptional regulator
MYSVKTPLSGPGHSGPSRSSGPTLARMPRTGPSEPRERLLRTAAGLFYREGINGVGVDRVLAEAGVTRATMYRHFPGKEALVTAYLELEDATIRGYFETAAAEVAETGAPPAALVDAVIEGIAQDAERFHTRGCPFINASAEYPDPDSPVRHVVRRHRDWFRATLAEVLTAAGVADPDAKAASLVLLRDAMLVGGYLDGTSVADDFRRTARAVLAS